MELASCECGTISVGKLQVAACKKGNRTLMNGNFLVFLEVRRGDLVRERALPHSGEETTIL